MSCVCVCVWGGGGGIVDLTSGGHVRFAMYKATLFHRSIFQVVGIIINGKLCMVVVSEQEENELVAWRSELIFSMRWF